MLLAVNLVLQEIEDFFGIFELVRLPGLADNVEEDLYLLVAGHRLGYVVAPTQALIVQSFGVQLLVYKGVV